MAFLGILTIPQASPPLSHNSRSQIGALGKVIKPESQDTDGLFGVVVYLGLGLAGSQV
jgi:hypothetical protein